MCISDSTLFFICKTLNVRRSDITYLEEQKIGMTNQSFLVIELFSAVEGGYIKVMCYPF